LLIITFCLTQVGVVEADGCAVRRPSNYPSWEYSDEENQVCYIEYNGGVESMLLSIDTTIGDGELVWIFPVPSSPEHVNISITSSFPTLKGVNVGETSKKVLGSAIANARNKVFIPFPDDFPESRGTYSMGGSVNGANTVESEEEVTVYKMVNMLGVTSLLLSSSSSQALESFLLDFDVVFPVEAQSVVDEYIGVDYCFVVSWVNNELVSSRNTLAIKLQYPTDAPFFPLRLTSVYGDLEIPITVYIRGDWKPTLYPSISRYSEIDYYTKATINYPYPKTGVTDVHYTRLVINSPSHLFSDDLWFKRGTTLSGLVSTLILENQFITWTMVEVLLFGVASLLAATAVLGTGIPKAKYFLLGSFNMFTVVVLAAAYLVVGAKRPEAGVPVYSGGLLNGERYRVAHRGLVFDTRVLAYMALFVPLMLSLSVILEYGASVLL
jgi:hypothetical protein